MWCHFIGSSNNKIGLKSSNFFDISYILSSQYHSFALILLFHDVLPISVYSYSPSIRSSYDFLSVCLSMCIYVFNNRWWLENLRLNWNTPNSRERRMRLTGMVGWSMPANENSDKVLPNSIFLVAGWYIVRWVCCTGVWVSSGRRHTHY